jgi:hypothetical protein
LDDELGEFYNYASIWIAPSDDAWVIIDKTVLKPKGSDDISVWGRQLIYHSTVHNSTYYNVVTIIGSFLVPHYEEYDFYTGLVAI